MFIETFEVWLSSRVLPIDECSFMCLMTLILGEKFWVLAYTHEYRPLLLTLIASAFRSARFT